MSRYVGSVATLKKARLPKGFEADQCFPWDESLPRTSKLNWFNDLINCLITLWLLALPVKRLASLVAVPQHEVYVIGGIGGVDVAGQLRLASDHRVHVEDGNWKVRTENFNTFDRHFMALNLCSSKAAKFVSKTPLLTLGSISRDAGRVVQISKDFYKETSDIIIDCWSFIKIRP